MNRRNYALGTSHASLLLQWKDCAFGMNESGWVETCVCTCLITFYLDASDYICHQSAYLYNACSVQKASTRIINLWRNRIFPRMLCIHDALCLHCVKRFVYIIIFVRDCLYASSIQYSILFRIRFWIIIRSAERAAFFFFFEWVDIWIFFSLSLVIICISNSCSDCFQLIRK